MSQSAVNKRANNSTRKNNVNLFFDKLSQDRQLFYQFLKFWDIPKNQRDKLTQKNIDGSFKQTGLTKNVFDKIDYSHIKNAKRKLYNRRHSRKNKISNLNLKVENIVEKKYLQRELNSNLWDKYQSSIEPSAESLTKYGLTKNEFNRLPTESRSIMRKFNYENNDKLMNMRYGTTKNVTGSPAAISSLDAAIDGIEERLDSVEKRLQTVYNATF
jgi:hypothetical protein